MLDQHAKYHVLEYSIRVDMLDCRYFTTLATYIRVVRCRSYVYT